jgi:polyferredoxin
VELPVLPTGAPQGQIRRQPRGFDLLSLPGLRRFVRWRYARAVFQVPLLILAILVIVDGLTGRQIAPRNLATTSVWLHYRGLVVLALALVGNAFCAACPLILTRGASRRLERWLPRTFSWPRVLRNKVFVAALTLAYLFSYEYFDLWASPWLTAWLAIGYFGAALVVDTLFSAGTFCRWVCPLGNFNFVLSSASPTLVTAVDHDICRSCEHKPCLHGRESYDDAGSARGEAAFIPLTEIANANGAGYFPGCETDLFVPTLQSNMDCTSCFNCVRACPYDNVALTTRAPTWEWLQAPWERRGRLALMVMAVGLTFLGVMNAAAMIGPFFDFVRWLSQLFSTENEAVLLGMLFVSVTAGGLLAATLFGTLADLAGGAGFAPRRALMRWGYVTVALGVGFWSAHYLFHFLTGALSIVPVFEHFFSYRGAAIDPNWRLAQIVPTRWLFPLTAGITSLYALIAAYVAIRIAVRDFGRRGALAMWPMLIYVILFAVMALLILGQPMEMRGTILGPTF